MTTAMNEEYDSFPTQDDNPTFLFDPSSMDLVRDDTTNRNRRTGPRSVRSQATTQLATDVGSTVLRSASPFLKSVTFFNPEVYYQTKTDGGDNVDADGAISVDDVTVNINDLTHWDIKLADPQSNNNSPQRKNILSRLAKISAFKSKPRLIIADFEGLIEFSSLQSGDVLVSINKKKIRAEEYSAERAMGYMRECLERDGVLCVTAENPEAGKDILINITVIKPKPGMTYHDLGLVVWNWPLLLVREIKKDSIFQHTALQETDQIATINDIDCSKMKEREFVQVVGNLPTEINLTVIRRKHRYSGSYS